MGCAGGGDDVIGPGSAEGEEFLGGGTEVAGQLEEFVTGDYRVDLVEAEDVDPDVICFEDGKIDLLIRQWILEYFVYFFIFVHKLKLRINATNTFDFSGRHGFQVWQYEADPGIWSSW